MKKIKLLILSTFLLVSVTAKANVGEFVGRVLGEVVLRLLIEFPIRVLFSDLVFTPRNIESIERFNTDPMDKSYFDYEQIKEVGFLSSINFVLNTSENNNCKSLGEGAHHGYFRDIVHFPDREEFLLWYNHQSIKEEALERGANQVLIKEQDTSFFSTEQKLEFFYCSENVFVDQSKCELLSTQKITFPSKKPRAKKNKTIDMLIEASKRGGSDIGKIKRTYMDITGKQRFQYSILKC